jgi:hypothetical protein
VPEDRTDDLTEAVMLKNAGIITINEARNKVDYEDVKGGDIFAPNGLIDTPGSIESPDETKPTKPTDQEVVDGEDEEEKRIYRKSGYKRKQVGQLPDSLAHLKNIKQLLRTKKMFVKKAYNHQLREMVKPTIRKMLAEGKTEEEAKEAAAEEMEQRISPYFTNEVIMTFYKSQIHTVEVLEKSFEKAIEKFIAKIEAQVLHNFDTELSNKTAIRKWIKKDGMTLFDDEKLRTQAQLDLTPILMSQIVIAGQDAFRLIGKNDTYIPYNVADKVATNVKQVYSVHARYRPRCAQQLNKQWL